MADEKRGWKQFQKLTFDSKKLSKKVKKAEGATVRHARRFIIGRLDNIKSVRRHIIGWLLFVGAMIIAVGVQFVWFGQGYQQESPDMGGTYAEASLGPINTLDPLYASSNAEIAVSRLLFSSLYHYDETGHLKGDLAESMQVDAIGKTYTITLRDNSYWHDGRPLTAKDVAFTINLIKNPETRSSLRVNWQDVNVKAVNDRTLEFNLPAVYAAFPNALTFSVLPEHILGQVAPGAIRENVFSQSPVGSGPFKFRLLQNASGSSQHKAVHLVANDAFYQKKPLISRFEIHAYDTQEAIVKALRAGEVNATADITGIDKSQIDGYNYTSTNQPVKSGVYAIFNNSYSILKDKTVRQALQLATDTQKIQDAVPAAKQALYLPFIATQVGGELPSQPAFDSVKAASLLDSAGWPLKGATRVNQDGRPLAVTIVTTKNPAYEKALEVLASQWRKIGVSVTTNVVNTADPATGFVQNILQARNYDVLLYELFIGADPDVYAYWHSSQATTNGYNFANYSNRIADDALSSARSRLEPELRNAKYRSFAKQWLDDAPAIGLYQPSVQYIHNINVSAVAADNTLVSSYDRYINVSDWSVSKKTVYKTP